SFCFDYYREVYQQFSDGMKLGQKQQTLLEYCENRNVTLQMLKNLKEFAPEQYEQHESRLYSSE
ncbi:MAG: hypothetical protein KDE19_18410, partial [Caldilineaceae bacterium]|nr:hypothetical protein [Caldilineaceae bacterium]